VSHSACVVNSAFAALDALHYQLEDGMQAWQCTGYPPHGIIATTAVSVQLKDFSFAVDRGNQPFVHVAHDLTRGAQVVSAVRGLGLLASAFGPLTAPDACSTLLKPLSLHDWTKRVVVFWREAYMCACQSLTTCTYCRLLVCWSPEWNPGAVACAQQCVARDCKQHVGPQRCTTGCLQAESLCSLQGR
jgi:hypothetical protein